MSSKMKIVLVLRTFYFFHARYAIWTRILGPESAKNWFLVIWSDTHSSPSSFMTCPSFQGSNVLLHIMWSLHTLFMAFCCCTSPKTLVQIQAVGYEKKIDQDSKTRTVFIFEDAVMRIILVYADDRGLQISASTVRNPQIWNHQNLPVLFSLPHMPYPNSD